MIYVYLVYLSADDGLVPKAQGSELSNQINVRYLEINGQRIKWLSELNKTYNQIFNIAFNPFKS